MSAMETKAFRSGPRDSLLV